MAQIKITLNEDGTLEFKTECEVGEEDISLEDIREYLKDIADIRVIERLPPKPPDGYEATKENERTKVVDREYLREG